MKKKNISDYPNSFIKRYSDTHKEELIKESFIYLFQNIKECTPNRRIILLQVFLQSLKRNNATHIIIPEKIDKKIYNKQHFHTMKIQLPESKPNTQKNLTEVNFHYVNNLNYNIITNKEFFKKNLQLIRYYFCDTEKQISHPSGHK